MRSLASRIGAPFLDREMLDRCGLERQGSERQGSERQGSERQPHRRRFVRPGLVLLSALVCISCDQKPNASSSTLGGLEPKAARAATAPAAAGDQSAKMPIPSKSPSASPQDDVRHEETGGPPSRTRSSSAEPTDEIPTDGPRVYALTRNVWIRSAPTSDVQWIGMMWMGGSVKIRGQKRVPGAGCAKEWVPIEPRGWVCLDGRRTTDDPDDPTLARLFPFRPRVETPYPHDYALIHAPLARYLALPSEEVQRARESGYERHMALVREARKNGQAAFPDHLGMVDVSLSRQAPPPFPLLESGLQDLPPGLSEGRTRMVARSAFAYAGKADVGDRTFLLASDMSWVPQDRVELVLPSDFQGVELGKTYRLPLAAFRGRNRPAYRLRPNAPPDAIPNHFQRLSFVNLSTETATVEDRVYQRVDGSDLWIDRADAVIPTPRERTPWGTPLDPNAPSDPAAAPAPEGRATWVEASVLDGWLLAFEGTRAVYATLISAGRGGIPQRGRDPLETASTPVGRFRFTGKFRTATMESSSSPILHADVPWTQNFSGPHALHSAYWHDDWGSLKSAGCVNVSPRDGKWLFEFTEPRVPDGWHGVRYLSRDGPPTEFIVHQ